MKISKHVHSCLLIQEAGKIILIDPGQYTYEAKALDLNSISNLDYLLITHEHPDHFYLPFIKEIIAKFPEVKILTNLSIVELLNKEGIQSASEGDDFVKIEEVPHEKIFGTDPPKNVMFIINDKLADPGDSHHFQTSAEILALPIQAPWGSTTAAVELAERLKPKVIIPIHDWHWNEQARLGMYQRLEKYFESLGIKFLGLKTGQEANIES